MRLSPITRGSRPRSATSSPGPRPPIPPTRVNFSITQQRAFYDKLCADFDQPHPPGLTTEDLTIADIPCRRYTPTRPKGGVTGIYFHGGGFVVGGLESHDAIVAELAERAGLTMIAVDYRLVPEHRHPGAYLDCLAVVDAVPGPKVLGRRQRGRDAGGVDQRGAAGAGGAGADLSRSGGRGLAQLHPPRQSPDAERR